MKIFTYGTTPEDVIRAALAEQCPDGYKMELVGDDLDLATRLINQGIDSHLEAITGTAEVKEQRIGGKVFQHRLHCRLDADGMVCLLRRLSECDEENAPSLRLAILSTIGIEEV